MNNNKSELCKARGQYAPKVPATLMNGLKKVVITKGEPTESVADQARIRELFPATYGAPVVNFEVGDVQDVRPLNIGVVLSGGQAPGGHNVIAGVYDGVKSASDKSHVIGFIGGPSGLVNNEYIEITDALMDAYRNMGGFDMIGSGRTKLESEAQFQKCIEVAKQHQLDGIVIIGGDDSNTNAAVLAEYFVAQKVPCAILGCPKTIDGDLKNQHIEASFGFDTASKTYAQLVGNIQRDAASARKYWHFIKLMGRSASHIGLEVALKTQPNYCLVSEEVEAQSRSLTSIVTELADIVTARALEGKNYGVALIPEGLVEFIPEVKALIRELNDALVGVEDEINAQKTVAGKVAIVNKGLTEKSAAVLSSLPEAIQAQLLLDRDPHGNVQVSLIETEKLLIELVAAEVKARSNSQVQFKALNHFFGYEGRCAHPSNFDADYGYALGMSAAVLTQNHLTGYISAVRNLKDGTDKWMAGGIPASMLMNIERRHGEDKPVIQKALVDLNGAAFKHFATHRDAWAKEDAYRYPGPIQFYGPEVLSDAITETLRMGC